MGKKVIPDNIRTLIRTIYNDPSFNSYRATSREYEKRTGDKIHKDTVKSIVLEDISQKESNLLATISQNKERQNKEILEYITNDTTMYDIIGLTLKELKNPETIKNEIKKYGIRSSITLIGTFIDKARQYEEMKIKKQIAENGVNVNVNTEQEKLMQEISNFTKDALNETD